MGISNTTQAVHAGGTEKKPQALLLRLQAARNALRHGKRCVPLDGLRTASAPMGARWREGEPRSA